MTAAACPLCNCKRHEPFDGAIVRCTGCGELLLPRELVRRATFFTRLRYNRRNQHHWSYT